MSKVVKYKTKRDNAKHAHNVQKELAKIVNDQALAARLLNDEIVITQWRSNAEYLAYLKNLDYTQWAGALELKGFGALDTQALKWWIYDQGAVVVYRNVSGTLEMGLPVPTDWTNMNNISAVRVVHPRGFGETPQRDLVVGSDCVILTDTEPNFMGALPASRGKLVDWCINIMADVLARLKMNIVLSGDKVWVQTPDVETIPEVTADLNKAYSTYSPFVVLADKIAQRIESQAMAVDPKFNELLELLKQLDIHRMTIHGVGTGGYGIDDITGHVDGESQAGEDNPKYVLKSRLQIWAKQCKELLLFLDCGVLPQVTIGGTCVEI